MLRENPAVELKEYISHLDKSEQSSLLRQFKLRDAIFKARAVDKKQKGFVKEKKRLTDSELSSIVRSIRKENAKKKT